VNHICAVICGVVPLKLDRDVCGLLIREITGDVSRIVVKTDVVWMWIKSNVCVRFDCGNHTYERDKYESKCYQYFFHDSFAITMLCL